MCVDTQGANGERVRWRTPDGATGGSALPEPPEGWHGAPLPTDTTVTDPIETTTDTTTDTTTEPTETGTHGGETLDPDSVPLPDPAFYDYSASVTFQVDDVVGGLDGVTAAEDPSILCDEATCPDNFADAPTSDLMAIDSDFGHWVQDFLGAFDEARDGDYDDGFIGSLTDPGGVHNGVQISSVATKAYQAGYPRGSWCGGLGEELVKCSTEHFVSMEHALTCYETIPYMSYDPVTGAPLDPLYDQVCQPLDLVPDAVVAGLSPYGDDFVDMAASQDYAVTLKDDGKYLYRWGTWEKEPTDVRLVTSIPLPAEWKDGNVYRITRAELAIVHTISNSPNDQIRPEDLENEAATGRLPSYTVQADGSWTSNVDCYESDGHLIPAGTVLKNPAWANPAGGSSDLKQGYTNAWYPRPRPVRGQPGDWRRAALAAEGAEVRPGHPGPRGPDGQLHDAADQQGLHQVQRGRAHRDGDRPDGLGGRRGVAAGAVHRLDGPDRPGDVGGVPGGHGQRHAADRGVRPRGVREGRVQDPEPVQGRALPRLRAGAVTWAAGGRSR